MANERKNVQQAAGRINTLDPLNPLAALIECGTGNFAVTKLGVGSVLITFVQSGSNPVANAGAGLDVSERVIHVGSNTPGSIPHVNPAGDSDETFQVDMLDWAVPSIPEAIEGVFSFTVDRVG